MNTQVQDDCAEPTGRATYCPEDNKIRLYVGRVPRPEYEALCAQGWTSTPKQECDFVAVWTPSRRDTALDYAGIIEDEDQSPAERAADRAERFSGYLGKRLAEAGAGADRFESGPSAFGFQNHARAERAAARFDRVAARAVDAWDKAEYWQRRTAGVISHALHLCSPSVRMGRIKDLELAIARHERSERDDNDWIIHYRLRLAYENQMMEAVGGRASVVEMVAGGFYDGMRIHRITKSPATGQAVSVMVRGKCRVWSHKISGYELVEGLHCINIERDTAGRYQAPTAEDLAQFEAEKKADAKTRKEAKKDAPPEPKLINPTPEEAARLQVIFNAANARCYGEQAHIETTQENYSAGLKVGACQTVELVGGGKEPSCSNDAVNLPTLAKVRMFRGRVVVLKDKPQATFPAELWVDPIPALRDALEPHAEAIAKAACGEGNWARWSEPETAALVRRARQARLFYVSSLSQFGLTDAGHKWLAQVRAKVAEAVTA